MRAFALTLVVVGVALADFLSGGAVRAAARPLMVPFANFGRASVSAVSAGDFWRSRAALIEENAELRVERDRLLAEGAAYDALRTDIDSLGKMAHLSAVESGVGNDEGITAPIVSSLRASPYGTFLIGAGMTRGVAKGSIVLGDSGFVIGVVSDVSNTSSIVRMLFAPGEKTEVVSGETGFTVVGRGGGNASAEVPREAPLNENDPVFAPLVRNRPIGIIGKIASSTSRAYADVYIIYPRNLSTVRYVYIIPGI